LKGDHYFINNLNQYTFYKPLSAKGLYGWLYRVYLEPWQVIFQTPQRTTTINNNRDGGTIVRQKVEESIVLLSNIRPSYQQAVNTLGAEASEVSASINNK
jgi:hypothetical protein